MPPTLTALLAAATIIATAIYVAYLLHSSTAGDMAPYWLLPGTLFRRLIVGIVCLYVVGVIINVITNATRIAQSISTQSSPEADTVLSDTSQPPPLSQRQFEKWLADCYPKDVGWYRLFTDPLVHQTSGTFGCDLAPLNTAFRSGNLFVQIDGQHQRVSVVSLMDNQGQLWHLTYGRLIPLRPDHDVWYVRTPTDRWGRKAPSVPVSIEYRGEDQAGTGVLTLEYLFDPKDRQRLESYLSGPTLPQRIDDVPVYWSVRVCYEPLIQQRTMDGQPSRWLPGTQLLGDASVPRVPEANRLAGARVAIARGDQIVHEWDDFTHRFYLSTEGLAAQGIELQGDEHLKVACAYPATVHLALQVRLFRQQSTR